MVRPSRAWLAALVAVVFLGLAQGAIAQQQIEVDRDLGRPRPGPEVVDLLEPTKNVLSGRSWLLVEGIDPGLTQRPGWDPLTRLAWDDLNLTLTQPGTPLYTSPSARLQAAGGATLVPFRDPAPAFSRDLLVTRDLSRIPFQTEPHLAVNPDDPDHLVLGVIDFNFPTISSYVSIDGGATWEGPRQVPFLLDDRVSGGDPVVGFDRAGNVYFAGISIGIEEFSFGPVVAFTQVSSIVVTGSEDGGFTWQDTVSTARSGVDTRDLRLDPLGRLRGTISLSFLDKPWMKVGPHHEDPDRDVVYLTYTDFEVLHEILWIGEVPTFLPKSVETTIRLVKSEDGGKTWTDPVAVSPTVARTFGEVQQPEGLPTGAATTKRTVQGSQPVIGPDGTVYVAWLDSTDDGSMEGQAQISMASSTDGGRSFSSPVVAASFEEIGFRPRNAFFRYWGGSFPQVAAGPEGDLYIAYTARPGDPSGDDGDIYLVRSSDGGRSWAEPARLNDDDGNALQFFPAIDVGPDGAVHVMWGDMRDDSSASRYHIYYTRSDDQGESWGFELEELDLEVGDARVTDFASNPNFGFPNGLFIGDYFSLKATEEDVYMTWADTRLGEFGPINQKIGFTRQRPIRSPEIFISPAAGPGGQGITVQGFDYQPDLNVFIQLEDATIATARTDENGFFETRMFVPVAGEGDQSLRVVDDSGNAATTSFFTEFGFGDIQDVVGIGEILSDNPRADELFQELSDVQAALQDSDPEGSSVPDVVWLVVGMLLMAVLGGGAFLLLQHRKTRAAPAAESLSSENPGSKSASHSGEESGGDRPDAPERATDGDGGAS